MKLRSLRKLEEIEIRKEMDKLIKEKQFLEGVIESKVKRWGLIAGEIKAVQKLFSKETALGARRTVIEHKTIENIVIPVDALIEKEPITIICSKLGWIKSMKTHSHQNDDIKYRDGDQENFVLRCSSVDRIIFFTKEGKCYTLLAANLMKLKGQGEPFRTMVDIEDKDDILNMFIYEPGTKIIIVANSGKGFIASHDDVIAQTKTGKKILNLQEGEAAFNIFKIISAEHRYVAVIGQNRKMLVFNIDEIPEMKRGSGVILQKYKDSKISDLVNFKKEEGIFWKSGEKTRTETDLTTWLGKRGAAGKMAPFGFPRNNKFA